MTERIDENTPIENIPIGKPFGWSGDPRELDVRFLILDGSSHAKADYPELGKKFGSKTPGENFKLPDRSGDFVLAYGAQLYYKSSDAGYREGYQEDPPGYYIVVRAK